MVRMSLPNSMPILLPYEVPSSLSVCSVYELAPPIKSNLKHSDNAPCKPPEFHRFYLVYLVSNIVGATGYECHLVNCLELRHDGLLWLEAYWLKVLKHTNYEVTVMLVGFKFLVTVFVLVIETRKSEVRFELNPKFLI